MGVDLESLFSQGFSKGKKANEAKRPNILVCGYTGSGKTSLIKSILGELVPAAAVGSGAPKTMGYERYENENVVVYDSKGLEAGVREESFIEETRTFVEQSLKNVQNVDQHIHLVWYAIQGPGARVTECDKHLMKELFSPEYLIVAITKSDITRPDQLDAVTKEIKSAGVPARRIIPVSDAESGSEGVLELMELSSSLLPDARKNSFNVAQQLDVKRQKEAILALKGRAHVVIGTATAAAAAIGAIPLPFSDAVALIPCQLAMIGELTAIYGMKEELVKNAVLPVIAQSGGVVAASSLSKFLPGLGSLISAGVASSLTGAMGWYVQSSLENAALDKIDGKTPEFHFDIASLWKLYKNTK